MLVLFPPPFPHARNAECQKNQHAVDKVEMVSPPGHHAMRYKERKAKSKQGKRGP